MQKAATYLLTTTLASLCELSQGLNLYNEKKTQPMDQTEALVLFGVTTCAFVIGCCCCIKYCCSEAASSHRYSRLFFNNEDASYKPNESRPSRTLCFNC